MNKNKVLAAFILVSFGVILRLLMVEFVNIPNLEIITAFALISGALLGGIFTFVVPLSIIAITDMYIGNNIVLIFTWSAFAVIGIFGWFLRNRKTSHYRFIAEMTGIGIISSLFFYLYTNFGWWLLSNTYTHTWQGLINCYVMGLPFLKTNLLGTLFFVPLFTSTALFVRVNLFSWFNLSLKYSKLKLKLK